MEYNIYLVDSFTDKAFKGNPSGVVPNAKRLNEDQMQQIAREINASETAFVTSSSEDSYKIKYFSPHNEVDFCGHSTLATFYILALRGYIKAIDSGVKPVHIISGKRKLDVEIYFYNHEIENIIVKMGSPEEVGVIEDSDYFLKDLGLKLEDINLDNKFNKIPIIKLGSKYCFIPIKEKEKLDNISIDSCSLKLKLEKLGLAGVHLFFLPERESRYVFTRNFSINMGLNEEAATGTANGGLIYLLKKRDLIDKDKIIAIQGETMDRKSTINCSVKEEEGRYKVEVGGKGKVVLEGIVNVE